MGCLQGQEVGFEMWLGYYIVFLQARNSTLLVPQSLLRSFNPLTLMNDYNRISCYNTNTISTR